MPRVAAEAAARLTSLKRPGSQGDLGRGFAPHGPPPSPPSILPPPGQVDPSPETIHAPLARPFSCPRRLLRVQGRPRSGRHLGDHGAECAGHGAVGMGDSRRRDLGFPFRGTGGLSNPQRHLRGSPWPIPTALDHHGMGRQRDLSTGARRHVDRDRSTGHRLVASSGTWTPATSRFALIRASVSWSNGSDSGRTGRWQTARGMQQTGHLSE